MPIFRYEALDKAGELRRGAMDAPNEQSVMQRLREMGFTPRAVASSSQPAAGAAPQAAKGTAVQARQSLHQGPFVTSSLPLADQALFWRQLSELSRAGLSPFEMFQSLGLRTANRRIRRAALDVAQRVQGGSSVADAMAANSAVFGTDFRVAVTAGETGGFVHDVYADLADALDDEKRHRDRWKWFRYYYNVNLVGSLWAVHFMVFSADWIMGQKNMPNMSTQQYDAMLVEGLRLWLISFTTRVVPLTIISYVVYRWIMNWMELGAGRPLADRLVLLIPGVSGFKRTRLLGRFYRMLRRLLSGGVPPIIAWDAAAEATGHHGLVQGLLLGREALKSGSGFGPALQMTGLVPDADIQMMATADRTGRIPETLQQLEADYEARAQSGSKSMRMLMLLPGAIIGSAIMVYGFYVAINTYFGLMFKMTGT